MITVKDGKNIQKKRKQGEKDEENQKNHHGMTK